MQGNAQGENDRLVLCRGARSSHGRVAGGCEPSRFTWTASQREPDSPVQAPRPQEQTGVRRPREEAVEKRPETRPSPGGGMAQFPSGGPPESRVRLCPPVRVRCGTRCSCLPSTPSSPGRSPRGFSLHAHLGPECPSQEASPNTRLKVPHSIPGARPQLGSCTASTAARGLP